MNTDGLFISYYASICTKVVTLMCLRESYEILGLLLLNCLVYIVSTINQETEFLHIKMMISMFRIY